MTQGSDEDSCAHERMVDDVPHDVGGGWVGQGYICSDCGFQTVRVETYVPVMKPCPRCGADFEGMPDVPSELCDACFQENLAAVIAESR